FDFVTPPPPPAAPSGLIASAVSASQINLTWADQSSNETNFILERSADAMATWSPIATPPANATSYKDSTGLNPGTRYYYRVRASNDGGDSANSNFNSAT